VPCLTTNSQVDFIIYPSCICTSTHFRPGSLCDIDVLSLFAGVVLQSWVHVSF
jgi:hypothetical protein